MRAPNYKYILQLLLLPFLYSCGEADEIGPADRQPEVETRFEMKLKDMEGSTLTRTDGAVDESEINNLKLFILPLDSDGNEIRNSNEIVVLDPVSLSAPASDGTITAVFVSIVPVGFKHIYVAANITSVQAGNIRNNWKYSLNSINNSEVINPLKTDGIAMWKQVLAKDGSGSTTSRIEIKANEGIVADLETVPMERVVAKVLLSCETDNQGYVAVAKNGWIKLDDIRYALDKTAKAFEWTKPVVAGDIQPEGLTNIVSYQDRNTAEWHKPVKAEQDATNYTGGIYCLENPAGNSEADDNATRMVVAAQYIPASIWVANGNTNEKRTFLSITEATAAINAQKDTDEENNTYWCYDGDECYTHQAMQNMMLSGIDMTKFSVHNAGWGYYMTYVNGIPNAAQRGIQWDREKSVIHRNSYHILKITRFNPPGIGELNDLTFEDNIQVYATIVDWKDKGGTNSDLEFNDAEQNKSL